MDRRLALLAALVALPWLSCSKASDRTGGGASGEHHPIVVVVFDGLRADRLASYGGDPGLTPNLDRFASGAVRFEWAFAQAPESAPSLASLLTGLYATTHGLVEEGDRLAGEAETVAELLNGAGFTTAAFLESTETRDDLGLAQGFETFDWAPGALDRGLGWLEQHAQDDAFVLLAPSPVAAAAGGDDPALYDQGVAAADQAFGRVLAALETTGLAERATVVALSLAGSDLGEHGATGRPSMYAQVTRVPVLLRDAVMPAAVTVEQIVELVDLAPSLLELVGESAPPAAQGGSLIPLIEGPGTPPHVAFGESAGGGGRFFAALGGYRLVLYEADDDAELYDLAADPSELDDLAEADERKVAVLRDHLGAWRKMTAAASLDPERRIEELDDDTLDQLKSLGYIQ